MSESDRLPPGDAAGERAPSSLASAANASLPSLGSAANASSAPSLSESMSSGQRDESALRAARWADDTRVGLRAGQMTRDVVALRRRCRSRCRQGKETFAPRAGQMTRDVGLRAGQMTRDVVALRVGEHAAWPRSKSFRQLLASSASTLLGRGQSHSGSCSPPVGSMRRTVNNAGSGNQRILTDAANGSAETRIQTNTNCHANQ